MMAEMGNPCILYCVVILIDTIIINKHYLLPYSPVGMSLMYIIDVVVCI